MVEGGEVGRDGVWRGAVRRGRSGQIWTLWMSAAAHRSLATWIVSANMVAALESAGAAFGRHQLRSTLHLWTRLTAVKGQAAARQRLARFQRLGRCFSLWRGEVHSVLVALCSAHLLARRRVALCWVAWRNSAQESAVSVFTRRHRCKSLAHTLAVWKAAEAAPATAAVLGSIAATLCVWMGRVDAALVCRMLLTRAFGHCRRSRCLRGWFMWRAAHFGARRQRSGVNEHVRRRL